MIKFQWISVKSITKKQPTSKLSKGFEIKELLHFISQKYLGIDNI